jgi:hypothetical protein
MSRVCRGALQHADERAKTCAQPLIAEEAAEVNPELVVRDEKGEVYTVRYDQVNAMLLNEFLKEHRAFVKEQLKVAEQQKEIDALREELKEQRYLIQKVCDKIDVSQSTTSVARREP